MVEKTSCAACGAKILVATANETGGLCMPCSRGMRGSIEVGKRCAEERRSRDQDPFWIAWTDICARKQSQGFQSLDRAEQELYAMNLTRGTVLRGGFHPYFDMATRTEVDAAKRAFRECGLPEISDLLEGAENVLFPEGMPKDSESQIEQMPCWTDEEIENEIEPEWAIALGIVSEAFYEVADKTDIAIQRYFDQHLKTD